MEYPIHNIPFKYYGRNVKLLIEKACSISEAEEKESAVIHIARLMKSLYLEWNKEYIEHSTLAEHIQKLSENQLSLNVEKAEQHNLLNISRKSPIQSRRNQHYKKKPKRKKTG